MLLYHKNIPKKAFYSHKYAKKYATKLQALKKWLHRAIRKLLEQTAGIELVSFISFRLVSFRTKYNRNIALLYRFFNGSNHLSSFRFISLC